jgi:hypothetical protein
MAVRRKKSLLWAFVDAYLYHTDTLRKGIDIMANSFERLSAAADRIADEIQSVADAIRNPAVDNNDQAQIDELAGRLEGAADSLAGLAEEERAEDAGGSSGSPTEEPVLEEPFPTAEGPAGEDSVKDEL